jgi:hypothetical protein
MHIMCVSLGILSLWIAAAIFSYMLLAIGFPIGLLVLCEIFTCGLFLVYETITSRGDYE